MSWSDAKIAFAEHFPHYEARGSQDALAEVIEKALADGAPLLAQAPTGTGKSFANLIPAIDFSLAQRKPVCAATGTKALQDQYIHDLETLKRVYFPELRYVVIKGRANYVCRAKVAEIRKGDAPSTMGADQLDAIEASAEEVDGDMERLSVPLSGVDKMALSTSSEECPGKNSCPFGAVCFAERVKVKAETAHVVVANHALVAVDAVLKAQGIAMLPQFGALIVDEGHEFEKYVSGALSTRVTERSITQLGSQVGEFTGERELVGEVNIAAEALFGQLRRVVRNRDDKRETSIPITPAILLELQAELGAILKVIAKMDAAMAMADGGSDERVLKRRRLRKRVASLADKVKEVIMADFGAMVRWVEREERKRYDGTTTETLALMQSPLEIADFLREAVWPWQPSVLVSATLAVGNDFSYLAGRLGMPEGYQHFLCESPFDYQTQAVTYVPKDMPDPVKESGAFRSAVNLNIAELVRAADGRALLLFTSWDGLRSAYGALAPLIASMGHKVLKQGDMPNLALRDEFKADEHSVLFAVKSFFTGMDIQGDSLRLLVIDKLPFPVPNVLFAAQCAAIDEKLAPSERFRKGSFMNRQVPEMIITLTQAVGRLIRSQSDRGLVAIMDPRIHSKPSYGKTTLRAIEAAYPSPLVTDLREATGYLRSLEEVMA